MIPCNPSSSHVWSNGYYCAFLKLSFFVYYLKLASLHTALKTQMCPSIHLTFVQRENNAAWVKHNYRGVYRVKLDQIHSIKLRKALRQILWSFAIESAVFTKNFSFNVFSPGISHRRWRQHCRRTQPLWFTPSTWLTTHLTTKVAFPSHPKSLTPSLPTLSGCRV